jgi:hypothetical protein
MAQIEKLSCTALAWRQWKKNTKTICHIVRVPAEIQTKRLLNTSSKMHYNLTLLRKLYKIQNNTWLRPTTIISNVFLYGEHLRKYTEKKFLTLWCHIHTAVGFATLDFHYSYIRNVWGIFIIHIKFYMHRCKTKWFMLSPTNKYVKNKSWGTGINFIMLQRTIVPLSPG